MDLTLDDVKQLLFELYLAQREVGRLRAANTELQAQLDAHSRGQVAAPGAGADT